MSPLTRPRHPLALALLAMALGLPALGLGFQLDDYYLRLALQRPAVDADWARTPDRVFEFFTGDPTFTRTVRDEGSVPWWTDERVKLAFYRPISGWTHALDFALWPDAPALMHVHSLLWLGACVAAAAVLYRQLDIPPAAAALAGLLFAIDDAHGTPAAWIANRNALVGTFFGLLALVAHDRGRRLGWRPGATLTPVLLLLGLLGSEIAVATGAYLLGYALFVDRAAPPSRIASLLPATLVGVAWAAAYRELGFGTAHSSLYIDPVGSPGAFAAALLERAPILFFGQWALPADLHGLMSSDAQRIFWIVAVVGAVAVGALLVPILRRSGVARFFATGMVLSLVPASATFPSNRLLMMAGIGGAGLLGLWMVAVREPASWVPSAGPARRALHVAWAAAIAVHVVIAPLGLLGAASSVRLLGDVPTRAQATLPGDPALAREHLVVVSAPTAFLASQSFLQHTLSGHPAPARAHVLASGVAPVLVQRMDERTLAVQPIGGWMPPPGNGRPAVDQHNIFGIFDRLYRNEPMVAGRRIDMDGVTAEVVEVTDDGRPELVRFRFDEPLERPGYRWLQWRGAGYEPFALPAVGGSVTLPAADVWPR